MESFGKTVLAIVTAALIVWLGYHFVIEVPAAKRAEEKHWRAYMDSVHRQQDLLNRWMDGGPDAKDARAEFYHEKAREEARQDRQRP